MASSMAANRCGMPFLTDMKMPLLTDFDLNADVLQFGLLHKVPFLSELSNPACITICAGLKILWLDPPPEMAETIMEEGADCEEMYLLRGTCIHNKSRNFHLILGLRNVHTHSPE